MLNLVSRIVLAIEVAILGLSGRHGDLDAAVAKLKGANQKGHHWADPLKALGDVLLKQAAMP